LEISTGEKYIEYTKENSETVPLSASFSFTMLAKVIVDNRSILVGEIHGVEVPIIGI